ncbi:hypothetical protein Hdeb2414_s0022g00614951 [Helianthus debilis subsp. tardiflorus]
MLKYPPIIGSSHGLFYLYGGYRKGCGAVIWNPSVRKAFLVVVPFVGDGIYESVVGFGICRDTIDPQIIQISKIETWSWIESRSCMSWQVEVFTLCSRALRSSYSSNLPRKSIHFGSYRVVIDGVLYCLATDRITNDRGYRIDNYNLIISIDMTTEELREINLPPILLHCFGDLFLSELRESLL